MTVQPNQLEENPQQRRYEFNIESLEASVKMRMKKTELFNSQLAG